MKTLLVLLSVLFVSSVSFAETINLKDGKTVTGKILQRDSSSVKVDVSGATMTYYADEIKDIDGVTLVPEVQKPAAVAAQAVTAVTKEDPAEKRALILKFIDVFGTRKLMSQNFDAMLTNVSEQKPEEAAKIRERVKVDEIIERLIPLYDKHFTAQELKAYIDFYSSPLGKKLLVNIGEVMKESIEVSGDYMKEKFPEEVNN